MQNRRAATQRDYEERILAVLVHIQGNLDGELDLDALASMANFSPFHFHRVFRGMVGEPVRAHVRRLRLERAAMQMKHGQESVTEAALAAGYETPEAFSRAFRARFGVSPRDYRASHLKAAPSGVHYSPEGRVDSFTPVEAKESMEVEVEDLGAMRLAFVRHLGPYDQVGRAWQRIYGWAGPKGLLGAKTLAFGICHDDPDVTPPERLRYDAAVTLSEASAGFEGEGEIGVQRVEGARYAKTTHVGSYARLGEVYASLLGQWMPAQDLRPMPGRPSLERYRNNPMMTPEHELRTDIYMPVDGPIDGSEVKR